MDKVAVLDSGGQYAHLIARKVRELGAFAEILPVSVPAEKVGAYSGLILSGGPSSVFDPHSPQPDPGLFEAGKPILGICYGHQLLAKYLGGTVERGDTREFGTATLRLRSAGGLFDGMRPELRVWMSHGDQVVGVPHRFEVLASTPECPVAAMGQPDRGLYGLQFHPEVVHTPSGPEILGNFLRHACGCAMSWQPESRIRDLVAGIRELAGDRRVLFFLSGGVDSVVAYTLTVRALGEERVEAVYVDTGLMRKGETAEIESAFSVLGLGRLRTVEASGMFLERLNGVVDPERKRAIIGQAFVDVQDQVLAGNSRSDWMLGQGTIYPDTIESGGTQAADVIKTHHNRVDRIQALIEKGRVLEPLSEFYKDEVRDLGAALGLPETVLRRHPFPGPGLAIRCLCADRGGRAAVDDGIADFAGRHGYSAFLLPLRSVGVQGDSRSYARLTVLHGAGLDYSRLLPLSTDITNRFPQTNRIVVALAPADLQPEEWEIRPSTITRPRVQILQRVDAAVTEYLRSSALYEAVWQCPVVLLPAIRGAGETVALRPVTSVDGMTAAVAELPERGLLDLAARLRSIDGVGSVVLDVSSKPPSTIEWE